jgi:carbon monoxide dehydrogenase subunit G
MAIELEKNFTVAAPIDKVWEFLLNPENVVTCMPGASLTELIDDKKFEGSVKVKIGAITAKYAGTITYTEADESAHKVVMLAEAKDKSGGTVNGTITTRLIETSPGETEAQCESSVDMTGRIVSVGRGMIDGVADQIIGKFVKNVKTLLEFDDTPQAVPAADGGAAQGDAGTTAPPVAPPQPKLDDADDAINIISVVLKVIRDWFSNFFKRLTGRGGQ